MKKSKWLGFFLCILTTGLLIISCPPDDTPLTLDVGSTTGGTTDPAGELNVESGKTYVVSAFPEERYNFAGWTFVESGGATLKEASDETTFLVIGTADCILQASFTEIEVEDLPNEILITATGGGTVIPSGVQTVVSGDSLSLSCTPDDCYAVQDILLDGSSVGASASYELSAITENHTIEVIFALREYTITIIPSTGGITSPAGVQTVDCGDDSAIYFIPDNGRSLLDVLVDGTSVGPISLYTFSEIRADHTIQGIFELLDYTVTTSAGSGGSVSPEGVSAVNHGDSLEVMIQPEDCYIISEVRVNGLPQGPVTGHTFTDIDDDQTLYATFERLSYSITANAMAGGSITPAGTTTVNCGSEQTYYIHPADCYAISDIIVNGESLGPLTSYTFLSLEADATITAIFALQQYSLSSTAGEGGSINPAGDLTVDCGASQSYAITANQDYHIAAVMINGLSIGPVSSCTIPNVRADQNIEAVFARDVYSITASAGPGGSITPEGETSVFGGSSQTFTIEASGCYSIAEILINGEAVEPDNSSTSRYTFTGVRSDQTISASFFQNEYTITATAGTGGSITPAGTRTLACGASASYSFIPADCYEISDVIVNSTSIGPVSSYEIANLQTDYTITATFARPEYLVSVEVVQDGSVAENANLGVLCGDTAVFTILMPTGYEIKNSQVSCGRVAIEGSISGGRQTISLNNIRSNCNVGIEIGRIIYNIYHNNPSGGSVTTNPASLTQIPYGSSFQVIVRADTNYTIGSFRVNGGSNLAAGETSYTWNSGAVTGNINIDVSFNYVEPITTVSYYASEGATDRTIRRLRPGESVTITTANSCAQHVYTCYFLYSWSRTGNAGISSTTAREVTITGGTTASTVTSNYGNCVQ